MEREDGRGLEAPCCPVLRGCVTWPIRAGIHDCAGPVAHIGEHGFKLSGALIATLAPGEIPTGSPVAMRSCLMASARPGATTARPRTVPGRPRAARRSRWKRQHPRPRDRPEGLVMAANTGVDDRRCCRLRKKICRTGKKICAFCRAGNVMRCRGIRCLMPGRQQ